MNFSKASEDTALASWLVITQLVNDLAEKEMIDKSALIGKLNRTVKELEEKETLHGVASALTSLTNMLTKEL